MEQVQSAGPHLLFVGKADLVAKLDVLATVEAADTQATLGPNHRRHSGKTESNLKFKHYKSALSREWIQSVTIPYTKRNFAHYKRYR